MITTGNPVCDRRRRQSFGSLPSVNRGGNKTKTVRCGKSTRNGDQDSAGPSNDGVADNGLQLPTSPSNTSSKSLSMEVRRLQQKYPPPGTPLPNLQRPLATRASPRRRDLDAEYKHEFSREGISLPAVEGRMRHTRQRRRRTRYDSDFPLGDVSTDKPVASQAVAFVIRASRHGVVPLCAEVANLFKENSNLADTVAHQRQEIIQLQQEVGVLREAVKGPPPVMKDFSFQTVQEIDCQTMTVDESSAQTLTVVIPCVRDDYLDDMKHDRPPSSRVPMRLPQGHREPDGTPFQCPGVKANCGSDVIVTCSCRPLMTTSTQNPIMISVGVNTSREECMDSALGYFEHTSLEKSHKQLEQKHSEVVEKNADMGKLNEDLDNNLKSAKEEIVTLQKAIQEMQNKEYERAKEEERLRYEDSYSVDVQKTWTSGDEEDSTKVMKQKAAASAEQPLSRLLPLLTADSAASSRTAAARSSIFPGPILGCKCQMCTAFFRSSGILGFACSPYVTDSSGRNPVLRDLRKLVWLQNSKLQIQPKDQIVARNNRLGTVRYVGHLDGVGTPSVVYIGLELENQDGRHDGYLHGKRYFFCPHRHGLFIPLQDVVCVINRKVTPPSAHPPVRKRQNAITGFDSRGRVANVSVSGIRRRRKVQASSDTSSDSTSSSTETSSTSTFGSSGRNSRERFPALTVK